MSFGSSSPAPAAAVPVVPTAPDPPPNPPMFGQNAPKTKAGSATQNPFSSAGTFASIMGGAGMQALTGNKSLLGQ